MPGHNFSSAWADMGIEANGLEITDSGLKYREGALLVRMRAAAEGLPDLALEADQDRMMAMLSIAVRRPVSPADVVPHVEVARNLWRQGDKALASLRLMFARLSGANDPTAADRVALAGHLLDEGWKPSALLEELDLAERPSLEKYNPRHVPAGNGRRSGQFDFRSGPSAATDGKIVVADEDEKEFELRDLLGEADPKEELRHNHPIELAPPIPVFGGALLRPVEALSGAATSAAAKVGPGKGPVYGTNVHTEFKNQVEGLGRPDLHPEQSYLDGNPVKYGTRGSVRVDVVYPTAGRPQTVYDLKTGGATLTDVRREQFRTHLPKRDDGKEIEIHEIRP